MQFCAKCVTVLAEEMLGRAKGYIIQEALKKSKHSSALVASLGRKPFSLAMTGLRGPVASLL